MTIVCQVCGTANTEGTTYCEGCGVELTAAPAPLTAGMPDPSPQDTGAPLESVGASDGIIVASVAPAVEPAAESDLTLPAGSVGAPAEEAALQGNTAAEASLPLSDLATPEAAAPVTEVAAAPGLTGEAKLGIKKFGAPTGEFIPLLGDRLVVGRFDASSGPVDIDLSSLGGQEHISRRHAELYRDQGAWAVRDLGSTNGVYIKRKGETGFSPRLQEPAPLADGDELAFGNLMLTFHQS